VTSGLNVKRLVWTIIFLGITLAAIVMEVVAGIWHPAGTIPWTEYIAQYVPWPVQLAAYVALAVWLPFHFWRADQKRKKAFTAGVHEGLSANRANHLDALEGAHAAGYVAAMKDHNIRAPSLADLLPEVSVQRGGLSYGPKCSHGRLFGSPGHVCAEMPSDAGR